MYKYFYPKQSQCSKVNYRWFYIWFEREICLVDYVFMGDWTVLASPSNAMDVIERMHRTFSCNFSPLKLNFPASLLRQLVICFMLFSDYYLELLILARVSFVSAAEWLLGAFCLHVHMVPFTCSICQQSDNNVFSTTGRDPNDNEVIIKMK